MWAYCSELSSEDWCSYKRKRFGQKDQVCSHTKERTGEHTARMWPSSNQRRKPWKEPDLLILSSWTSNFQYYEQTDLCYVSQPVCTFMVSLDNNYSKEVPSSWVTISACTLYYATLHSSRSSCNRTVLVGQEANDHPFLKIPLQMVLGFSEER